jgi:8-oxo-dGTP pyrophosphatase MutT (NUDIX family)
MHEKLEQNPCPTAAARVPAAVLMALTDESDPHLLLIRRSLHLSAHPGEIALPGGKADADDIDLRDTALREAWEEIRLPRDCFGYGGHLTPRVSMLGLAVTAIAGVVSVDVPLQMQAVEVEEIIHAPLAFFAERKNLRADRVIRNGEVRIAARYQYRHYTIWGITAGFIVDLVNKLYDARLDVDARLRNILAETH